MCASGGSGLPSVMVTAVSGMQTCIAHAQAGPVQGASKGHRLTEEMLWTMYSKGVNAYEPCFAGC